MANGIHGKSRHTAAVALVAIALLASGGCAKKKAPVTAPAMEQASIEPAPAPMHTAPPAAAATDPWSGDLESVNRYAREQGLLGDVYFDYDRAELRADARERLEKNSRFLTEHPEFVVRVEGHCDERGTADYNLALGQIRAGAARVYVGALGAPSDHLEVVSYGKERPECTDASENCWWRNRKAAFVIVGRRS